MGGQQKKQLVGNLKNLRRGTLGPAIVAEVDRLVAAEGIKKRDAFQRIASSTGRSLGTVSVTYYRITGKQKKAPARRSTAQTKRRGTSSTGSASRILRELTMLVRAQEQEITQLRKENARFAEIRRLLA